MIDFKRQLAESLKEMPSPLEDQKKLIRHLLTLEPDSDPAWDCITMYDRWVVTHETPRPPSTTLHGDFRKNSFPFANFSRIGRIFPEWHTQGVWAAPRNRDLLL